MPAQFDILDCVDLTRRQSAAALQTASDELRSIRGQISASKEGIADSRELLAWVEREMVRAKPNGNLR
jgi:hypothetical protein